MNPDLRYELEPHDRSVTVRLVGELDLATVDAFQAKSNDHPPQRDPWIVND